ncbi:hypothetical protein [Pedobacter sp.]|uniref:hypothetical protein n=1 Tax=Pedobacter sp. TaxID=1411316 RepID=UPI003D7F780E
MKQKRILMAFVLGAMLLSCSTSTKITGSWVDPAAKGMVVAGKTVFIACLTSNIEVRTKLENALAQQAALRGIKAVESSNFFSPDFYKTKPTEQELANLIKGTGAEAILTVSLIKKESETRYVPGSGVYAPYPYYGWYGGFYSYYNYWYPMFYDPGYYVTDKIYFLESNLYDAATGKLLWSAQSQTVSPGSIDSFVKSYPKVLVDQLIKDGVLSN